LVFIVPTFEDEKAARALVAGFTAITETVFDV
jgi:hypothetical protein